MSFNNDPSKHVVTSNLLSTFEWLLMNKDCYDSFTYDAVSNELIVHHANGTDEIREGDYLNAAYGILITAHNFSK